MAIFPVGLAVIVLLDGRAIPSYGGAYEAGGRILGPVVPFVSAVAERGWRDGADAVFERDGYRVRIRVGSGGLERQDVALAAAMRGLGERVLYDAQRRTLFVTTPHLRRAPLQTPTPFAGSAQAVPPRSVFTPEPAVTPRPVWSGSPLPRRTPLPYPPRASSAWR